MKKAEPEMTLPFYHQPPYIVPMRFDLERTISGMSGYGFFFYRLFTVFNLDNQKPALVLSSDPKPETAISFRETNLLSCEILALRAIEMSPGQLHV